MADNLKNNPSPIEIVPSLLSADFACLTKEIRKVEEAGCHSIHLDVMDGHFVPNITIGPVVAAAIRRITRLYCVAHLMIDDPDMFIRQFKESGMDELIIHSEIKADFIKTLSSIKRMGMAAGVSVKPKTPVDIIEPAIDLLDSLLIMSVEPGFGGQKFIRGSEKKVGMAREILRRHGRRIPIGVDGGINIETLRRVIKAGATRLIAGSAIFSGDIKRNIAELRKTASGILGI